MSVTELDQPGTPTVDAEEARRARGRRIWLIP